MSTVERGMDRWRGRAAVVTGASSGIGAAIAHQLQDAGVNVVALARREDTIQEAVERARKETSARGRTSIGKIGCPGTLHCLKCDVENEDEIKEAFGWIKANTGGIDILINNAGVLYDNLLTEAKTEEWRHQLDINVLGLSICTREAVQQMRERGVDDGHIIHLSSLAAHTMPALPGMSMYYASKHAVHVLAEGLRMELTAAKSKIRVSEISPGLVRTNILDNMTKLTPDVAWQHPHIQPEDVADTVLYVLCAPPHVQIRDIQCSAV